MTGKSWLKGCFHSGAVHEEPDLLKDELQLYGGKSLSSGLGEKGTTQRRELSGLCGTETRSQGCFNGLKSARKI